MFVIVRHGNTFAAGESPRRIGARTDLPLTDEGHQQAQALGAFFSAQGWHFSRALASPLLRTCQTAEAILVAQPRRITLEHAEFLREIDHGPDEDCPEEVVIARIGAEVLAAWDKDAIPPPGWTVNAARRTAAWRNLFTSTLPEAGPTLLVTSNGAARFALLAAPVLRPSETLKLPTGSYGVILQQPGGALEISVWGKRP